MFLTVLESGVSKINALVDSVFGMPISSWLSSHYTSQGGRNKGFLWGLFYKGANPIYENSAFKA
jgi:hypothetical protein